MSDDKQHSQQLDTDDASVLRQLLHSLQGISPVAGVDILPVIVESSDS